MDDEQTTAEFGTGLREHLRRNPCWLADGRVELPIDALFALFAQGEDVPERVRPALAPA